MAGKAKVPTGQAGTQALRPIWKDGGWRIAEGRVAAESPEAAASFAADLLASLRAHSAVEDARPRPDGSGHDPCEGARTGVYGCSTRVHTAGCQYSIGSPIPPLSAEMRALAARFAAGRPPVESAAKKAPSRRTRTAVKPEPIVAPAAVTTAGIGPCGRCGRTDWRTAAGRAWHVANNPDCAKYRKPGRHQYAA